MSSKMCVLLDLFMGYIMRRRILLCLNYFFHFKHAGQLFRISQMTERGAKGLDGEQITFRKEGFGVG